MRETVTLTDVLSSATDLCASEPIHSPGSIQDHAVLLGLDGATLTVVTYSANLWQYHPPVRCGDSPIWLPQPLLDACRQLADQPGAQQVLHLPLPGYDVVEIHLFVDGAVVFCEWEPIPPGRNVSMAPDAASLLTQSLGRMQSAVDIGQLSHEITHVVRRLTGFERVMAYGFDDDGDGNVLGESKVDDWQKSFLGLRFPAMDIPPQARALYQRTSDRWLPTRSYDPVALIPQCDARGMPFDLGLSRYRSVSPVHRLYQANIQVDGSMSVSVMVNGRLWGLIIGHHRSPHSVCSQVRTLVLAAVHGFSMQLVALENRNTCIELERDVLSYSAILRKLAAADDYVAALTVGHPDVLHLLPDCSGAAVVWQTPSGTTGIRTLGDVPPDAQILTLVDWVREKAGESVFVTDALSSVFPDFAEYTSQASGLLACFFDDSRHPGLLLFRPEIVQSVAWAGRPEKIQDASGMLSLPRRSFDRWVEVRRGQSSPWKRWEVDVATTVQATINDVIIRQRRRVEELEQFSYAVSHDLRQPLRTIAGYLGIILRQHRAELGPDLLTLMTEAVEAAKRLDRMIVSLLEYSRAGRDTSQQEDVDLSSVLAEAITTLDTAITEAQANLTAFDTGAVVQGNRLDLLRLFQNLIGNAVKYRFADRPVQIAIHCDDLGDRWAVRVQDNGIGIAPKDYERAFGVFQRLVGSDQYEGTGIGLSVCKKIVERHGGRIWITSELGQGTTFHILLPKDKGRSTQ